MHTRTVSFFTIGIISFVIISLITCEQAPDNKPVAVSASDVAVAENSFLFDLNFLKDYDSSLVVLESGRSKIIVSPKYQGKVFTSTADGDSGTSFGWVHYKAFGAPPDPHINAYGGENRLWLGPEGNRFSLFFAKGQKQEFANWKTPAAFDTESWVLDAKSATGVQLSKKTELENYAGSHFSLTINRNITILDTAGIVRLFLYLPLDESVHIVGYSTENTITNSGNTAWTEATGAPCIWMLDMFPPTDHTTVFMHYSKDIPSPVTSNYFGEIDSSRLHINNGMLFFKADGKSRGKLGIRPEATSSIAGSYDAQNKVLTVILFDCDRDPKSKYLNQEWNSTKPPYAGDDVNAYNDGPLALGGQLGPFYELESVSPAAFLKPGASLSYRHSVLHFTGDENALNMIAQKTMGITLEQVKAALK